jgi:hypothetical protein
MRDGENLPERRNALEVLELIPPVVLLGAPAQDLDQTMGFVTF